MPYNIQKDFIEPLKKVKLMKNPYYGITWAKNLNGEEQKAVIRVWKGLDRCNNGNHLFDEVWNGQDHYLNCDVCDLVVNISSIDDKYIEKDE